MKTNLTPAACAFALTLVATLANAALIDRGGGLIYDADLNVTWLANANYAQTSGFDSDGLMSWSQAQDWVTSLNTANHLGYSNWRLPATPQIDAACSSQVGGTSFGYNCTGSEMGHLFYNELGGIASSSILSSSDTDMALFNNFQAHYYWSGTEFALTSGYAWVLDFSNGGQSFDYTNAYFYALAVRTGDVAAVPVPAAAWLFGSGLLGLIGVARRKA